MSSRIPFLATTAFFLTLLSPASASPLSLSLSSCATPSTNNASFNNAGLLDFSQAFGQLIPNQEQLVGPSGETGDWLLRLNLVGETGEAVTGYDNATEKLATLFTSISFLSAPIISSTSSLCYSLHSSPPTALPANDPTTCTIPAGPVSLNLSIPLDSFYPLTTLRTHIRIVDTAYPNPNELACIDVSLSPYVPTHWSYKLFLWIPVGIAAAFWAVLWGARLVAGWATGRKKERERVGKKQGSLGRVTWTAMMSTVSGDVLVTSVGLLRFVTPGFRDIIFHLQFCSSLSMIAVLWPEFVYPIASRGAWASLIGNVTLVQSSPADRFDPLYSNYTSPPSAFASDFTDSSSALYLDASAPNRILHLAAKPGMASFAHAVGLREQDLFGTSAAIFLLICAAVVVISLIIWAIHGVGEYVMARHEREAGYADSPQRFEVGLGGSAKEDDGEGSSDRKGDVHQPPTAVRRQWWKFGVKGGVGAFYASSLQGNLTRILILFHLPISTFAVYQFTIYPGPASITSVALAALFFLFICLLIPAYLIFRLYTVPSPKLYDATRTLLSLGPLYTLYGEGSQLYAGVLLGTNIVAAAVIGGGQASGTAQAVILLVLEIVLSLVTSIWLPWGEGASMGATSFLLCVARIISLVLVLVLCQAVDVGSAASSWIAYAVIIIQAVIFLLFTLILIVKIIEAITRLIVHAPFDESEEQFDTGLLGAMSKLSCCGDDLLRASGRRRRRRAAINNKAGKKGSRAPSIGSTQLMLGGGGAISPQRSPGYNPGYSPYDPRTTPGGGRGLGDDQSYFMQQQQYSQHHHQLSNGAGGAEQTGFIMGGWRDVPQSYGNGDGRTCYENPSRDVYLPSPGPSYINPSAPPTPGEGPKRGFSVVRGGRSAYETPYALVPSQTNSTHQPHASVSSSSFINTRPPSASAAPSNDPGSSSSGSRTSYQPPSIPLSPVKGSSETPRPRVHQRTRSQTAVIETIPLGPAVGGSSHHHYPQHQQQQQHPHHLLLSQHHQQQQPQQQHQHQQHHYPSSTSLSSTPFGTPGAYTIKPFDRDDGTGSSTTSDGNDSDDTSKPSQKNGPRRHSWFARASGGGGGGPVGGSTEDSDDEAKSPMEELKSGGESGGGGSRWPFGRKKGRVSEGDANITPATGLKDGVSSGGGRDTSFLSTPFSSSSALGSASASAGAGGGGSTDPMNAQQHRKTFSVARPMMKAHSADGHSTPSTPSMAYPDQPLSPTTRPVAQPASSSFIVKRPNQTRKTTTTNPPPVPDSSSDPNPSSLVRSSSGSVPRGSALQIAPVHLPPVEGVMVVGATDASAMGGVVPVGPNKPLVPMGPNFGHGGPARGGLR